MTEFTTNTEVEFNERDDSALYISWSQLEGYQDAWYAPLSDFRSEDDDLPTFIDVDGARFELNAVTDSGYEYASDDTDRLVFLEVTK